MLSIFLGTGVLFLSSVATQYVANLGFFGEKKGWQVTIVVMSCSPLLLVFAEPFSQGRGFSPLSVVWIVLSWWMRGGVTNSGLSVFSFGLLFAQVGTPLLLQVNLSFEPLFFASYYLSWQRNSELTAQAAYHYKRTLAIGVVALLR